MRGAQQTCLVDAVSSATLAVMRPPVQVLTILQGSGPFSYSGVVLEANTYIGPPN